MATAWCSTSHLHWCVCTHVSVWWLSCLLATAWGRLPRTRMHAEIGASLSRSLSSLRRTMAASDAWLSRSLKESVRDRGPLTGPRLPDIYAFAKFNMCTQNSIFADEGWCWNAFLTAQMNKWTLKTQLEWVFLVMTFSTLASWPCLLLSLSLILCNYC